MKNKKDNISDLQNIEINIPFRVLESHTDLEKYPVIVFLHGAGERGNDNEFQLHHIAKFLQDSSTQAKYPHIAIFPQCPLDKYWAPVSINDNVWTVDSEGAMTMPMQEVEKLIEQVRQHPRVDTSRVYLAGLSMGGFGTFDLLCRRPEWFAAAIAICGGADLDKLKEVIKKPVRVFHGAKDPVVPVSLSRDVDSLNTALGGSFEYFEYPEGDHLVWDQAMEDPATLKWLFEQKL